MKTQTTDTAARAALDSAAASLGWTVTTPPKLYKDDPEPDPLPVYVTDPATGRALYIRRVTYPASQAGRLSISPRWPESGTGRSYTPREMPPTATLAGDTAPAAIARRLARYMTETADAYAEAIAERDSYEAHARAQADTIAALVAGGWRKPSRHAPASPCVPELAGNAYGTAAHVSGDSVQFEVRGLTTGQALAVSRILSAGPPVDPLAPIRALVALAERQLDQSATQDGLTNADALAAVRRLLD